MKRFLSAAALLCFMAAAPVFAQPSPENGPAKPHARANDELSTPTVLFNFGTTRQYEAPTFNLIQAQDGNFYGSAYDQVNNVDIIFQLTPAGGFKPVYSFPPGSFVNTPLSQGADGNLYGAASELDFATYVQHRVRPARSREKHLRPDDSGLDPYVFAFNIARSTVLNTYPLSGVTSSALRPDSAGNLYGTTSFGGTYQAGSIFKLTLPTTNPTTTGTLNDIYSFTNGTDGGNPVGSVVTASDGYLYGATDQSCDAGEEGGIFRFDAAVSTFTNLGCMDTLLTSFDGGNGFTQASDGSLYSFNAAGGANDAGEAFKLDLQDLSVSSVLAFSGTDGTPCTFCDFYTDNNGNLIYTSTYGGSNYNGSLQSFNAAGANDLIYTFPADDSTGANPSGNPIIGSNGMLYAAASIGGDGSDGTFVMFPQNSAFQSMLSLVPSVTTASIQQPVTLSWEAKNAFSISDQACFAYSSDWSFNGPQPPSGSITLYPAHAGTHTYAITCGGFESGTAVVHVNQGFIAVTSNSNPVTSRSYNFGAVASGSQASYTLTLINNGYVPFPLGITKTGKTSGAFASTNSCNGSIAPGGGSCNVTIYCLPGVLESDQAIFTIADQGFAFTPGNSFTFNAKSVPGGVVSLSSTSHNFGQVPADNNYSYSFTVYNGTDTTQPLTLTGSSSNAPAAMSAFTTTCPATLAVNQACTVTFNMTPSNQVTGPTPYEYDIILSTTAAITPGRVVKLRAVLLPTN